MSNITHTPGPWYVQTADDNGAYIIKPVPGDVVAECDQLPNAKANAQLIAAAPTMLDALRLASVQLEDLANIFIGDEFVKAREAVDAAIALAEVKQS